jgi:hypothetical protein
VLDLYPTHISVIENKHNFLLQIIADKKFAISPNNSLGEQLANEELRYLNWTQLKC